MYFGIYGFDFKEEIRCDELGLTLIPSKKLTSQDRSKKAKDRKKYYLTGLVEIDSIDPKTEEKIWIISDILTFCQQQAVIVTYDHRKAEEDFPECLDYQMGRSGRQNGGDLCFDDESRKKLISLLCNKLQNESFLKTTDFDKAFYRSVEIWRLSSHLMEITYYFCFSAIETLARTDQNGCENKNVAQVVAPFLVKMGFCICQNEFQDYSSLRNALFHNSKTEKEVNNNGNKKLLKLEEFEGKIMRLLPYVILKVADFENEHINWNAWDDLMAFR
jgi:hypothetical protein